MAQQCFVDLQKFDEDLARVGFGTLPPADIPPGTYEESVRPGYSIWGVTQTPREKIRALRDAASVYALDGDGQSCEMVLTSMRKVFEKHPRVLAAQAGGSNPEAAWRRAHLARAQPVADMNHLMRADLVIGAELRNANDTRLGEVKDLVLDPQKDEVLYVLVAHGGFLGFGKKLAVVRWRDLRATADHELYALDVPPKVLAGAPELDSRSVATIADAAWQRALDQYWDNALAR